MKREQLQRITGLAEDDRAVSPVVGVALLIAITVILAAVIGFVVLDTSTSTTEAPNARLTFTGTADTTVSHEGGDSFDPSNVAVKVNGSSYGTLAAGGNFTVAGDSFNTGDTFSVNATAGETVVVLWDDPQSDREVQLGKATVE
jgi:flagellin-like protein